MKLRAFAFPRWVFPIQDECKTIDVDELYGLGVIDRSQVIEMGNLITRLDPAILN